MDTGRMRFHASKVCRLKRPVSFIFLAAAGVTEAAVFGQQTK
jgi:hypothetical protein